MPKKAKKPIRSKLIKNLDVIFSQYIRLKYADNNGMVKCFTCEKVGHWKNGGIQCGHFRSRRFYATRFDENNCRPQCVRCNMFDSGRSYEFALNLGEQLAKEMFLKSQKTIKFTNDELIEMIDSFTSKVKKMT